MNRSAKRYRDGFYKEADWHVADQGLGLDPMAGRICCKPYMQKILEEAT
jgi:hypothetical protein